MDIFEFIGFSGHGLEDGTSRRMSIDIGPKPFC